MQHCEADGVLRLYGHNIAFYCCHMALQGVCAFWGWLFTLSKMVELGDTIFIVVRKQELIFLHWYACERSQT